MDVWTLRLRWGRTIVTFGIERGFSYPATVDHPALLRPPSGYSEPGWGTAWYVWASRHGGAAITSPDDLRDAPVMDSWRDVVEWLDAAPDAEVAPVDLVDDVLYDWVTEEDADHILGRIPNPISAAEGLRMLERAARGERKLLRPDPNAAEHRRRLERVMEELHALGAADLAALLADLVDRDGWQVGDTYGPDPRPHHPTFAHLLRGDTEVVLYVEGGTVRPPYVRHWVLRDRLSSDRRPTLTAVAFVRARRTGDEFRLADTDELFTMRLSSAHSRRALDWLDGATPADFAAIRAVWDVVAGPRPIGQASDEPSRLDPGTRLRRAEAAAIA